MVTASMVDCCSVALVSQPSNTSQSQLVIYSIGPVLHCLTDGAAEDWIAYEDVDAEHENLMPSLMQQHHFQTSLAESNRAADHVRNSQSLQSDTCTIQYATRRQTFANQLPPCSDQYETPPAFCQFLRRSRLCIKRTAICCRILFS